MRNLPRHSTNVAVSLALLVANLQAATPGGDTEAIEPTQPSTVNGKALTLEECLRLALKQNHRRPVSQFQVAAAEAQHRQALAGYWPQINFSGGYQRLDQPMNFLFPAGVLGIPAQSVQVPGGSMTVTIPANSLAPGFPPAAVQMPVNLPGQTVQTAAQTFSIPQQNVKLIEQNLVTGSVDMKWLLYDGGWRSGLRQQSGAWLDIMRQEARRTDLDITASVKRFYWGAVLAQQLHQLGEDTLARMEVTLKLTESLYKESSGKVTKADYLDNQVMVETLRAMLATLEKNEKMAQSALANTMGLAWNETVRPSSAEIPAEASAGNIDELVGTSYRFSPDWLKLEAALRAAEGAVRSAKSEYYPRIALTGELHRWWNGGYNEGISTPENRAGWVAGIGIEVPIFNGLLTRNKIGEARAKLQQLKESQFLLREGLGIRIKDLMLGLDAAIKADQATFRAMKSAEDNRDLNTRAYENGLVETEKVIRAELVEALMSAQHYMARYQVCELFSQLGEVVGAEVQNKLGIQ